MRWMIVITRTKTGLAVECATKARLTKAEKDECEQAYRAVCSLPKK
jgi:hypothetical protein